MPVLRTRNAAVTCKIESTPGVFSAPNTTTDGVLIERPRIMYGTQNTQTDEVTGSLDPEAPIVGGMQCTIDFPFYIKGGVTPGVAPEWGKIARICGWGEVATLQTISGTGIALGDAVTITDSGNGLAALTVGTVAHLTTPLGQTGEFVVTASAAGSLTIARTDGGTFVAETAGATFTIRYGVAAATATAGTTISFTGAAPMAATANLYRGMPVLLSGNPATPEYVVINAYSAARLAEITKLMGSALTTSTKASIPANVRYQPTSSSIPAGSIEVYMDGIRRRFRGCRGSLRLEAMAGGAWKGTVSLRGLFESRTDTAMITPTYDATRPGIWRASRFAIDRATCGLRQLGLNVEGQIEFPGNPNDTEGFDPPEITARSGVTVTGNPYETLVATRDLLSKLRAGTDILVDAQMKGNTAANPGQRLALTVPTARITRDDPDSDGNLAVESRRVLPRRRRRVPACDLVSARRLVR